MSYATQQDLIDRYGFNEVAIAADCDHNRSNNGEIDSTRIDTALHDATAEVNGYISVAYDLPLPAQSSLVKSLCCDIALYKLSLGTALTDENRTRYEDAIKLLQKIANGEINLGFPKEQPVSGDNTVELISPPRQFNRKNNNRIF